MLGKHPQGTEKQPLCLLPCQLVPHTSGRCLKNPMASLPYLPRRHTARGPASPQGPGKCHPPLQVLQTSIFWPLLSVGKAGLCVRGTAGGQAGKHLPSAQALPLFEVEVGT